MTKLQRMKMLATGLLVLAGVVYATAILFEARYPWLYYVAAAAEAAMIGAIADWFAVVALFHHPLNLRFIPHTAILPRNKARIAQGLSDFIQQNFLSSRAVVERIAAFRPAATLCAWLLKPQNAETLAGYFARLTAYGLTAIDDARVSGFLLRAVSDKLRRADVASAAAQLLDVLTEDRRHHALLDEALAALDDLLAREETRGAIAEEVARNAPLLKYFSDLFHLKLDQRAALRIVEVALNKISEVRRDRDHELRKRFDAFVARFVESLKSDPATRARVARMRDELLENPALAGYIGGLWEEFRGWLAADLGGEVSMVRQRTASLIVGFGQQIAADSGVQQWIDEQILTALPALVEEHRAKFGRFVEDQINSWQEEKLVAELERHIGPDLQYIRINGTVVGGLAGLLIAAMTRLVH
ncbi:MAG: hypothetical protein A3G81_26965 [Betaproteobacteria bacterium RIFCSPLOWO2_12_FULL_65_14]|nr:MAG: hypothetical protein A3G81_26965 [Betaproteobacteria bacterium RIFCSPLOWO2_12_FULL_65_14]